MGLIGIDLHTDSFYVVRTRLTDKGQIRTERKYDLHGESLRLFTDSLNNEDYVLLEATFAKKLLSSRIERLNSSTFVMLLGDRFLFMILYAWRRAGDSQSEPLDT